MGRDAPQRRIQIRLNQETEGVAVELGDAAEPFLARESRPSRSQTFDRHAGVGETSSALYLTPNLVDMSKAERPALTMPAHLEKMLPDVVSGDPTATRVFLAEGLKAKETGKGTSTREMSNTGQWGLRDPHEATAEQGRRETEAFVSAAVQFIETWKQLRPLRR